MPWVGADGRDAVITKNDATGQKPAGAPARRATGESGKAIRHALDHSRGSYDNRHAVDVSFQFATSAWNVHDTAPSHSGRVRTGPGGSTTSRSNAASE